MNDVQFLPESYEGSDPDWGRRPDFAQAFDPDTLAAAIEVASTRIEAHLRDDTVRGLVLDRPHDLLAEARALMTSDGAPQFDARRLGQIVDLHIRTAIALNSRGSMARQFSSVIPLSAAYDLVSAMVPQPASFYEAGALANVADKLIAEEFGRWLGWETGGYDMISTTGASLANLTALLAARNARVGQSWSQGVRAGDRGIPAIAIGEDAHYSVARVAGIIGIGQDNLVRLPVNAARQIAVEGAAVALDRARAEGREVFALVASAGSTATGAIDPLAELAALARERNLWFHVDAAHSGAFLVSDRLRPRLRGIEQADSFCLDAHKTLFVPGPCTLLFYREAAKARGAFAQKASYVFEHEEDEVSRFESAAKNFECTKRPSILSLWVAWAMYGRGVFAQKLDRLVAMTLAAHDYLAAEPDFRVAHRPESNILCFEYCPRGLGAERISALQLALRDGVRAAGRFFLSKVELDGRNVLRLVLMNHRIGLGDIADMADEVRRVGREIMAGWAARPHESAPQRPAQPASR